MQTPEAFIVGHNSVVTAGRVARDRSALRRNFYSLGLLAAIAVGYFFFLRGQVSMNQVLAGFIPATVIWVGFLVWRLLALRSSRADLARIPGGEAFRVDHAGITLAATGQTIGWGDIRELKAEGKMSGAGPVLILEHTGGRYEVPLSFLDALPGTIDSALRAYSGARRGLNLSNLDSVNSF